MEVNCGQLWFPLRFSLEIVYNNCIAGGVSDHINVEASIFG